jgi:hypothetical protein
MAISAEQLNVILSARDREFTKAMDRAQNRVNRFAQRSNKDLSATGKAFDLLATSAKRLGPAIAAALSVQAFRGALSAASEIDNLSRIAGVASDQFQVLALTSQQFGIGQEKLSDILKDVNDKFGDYAQTGAGPLADFFENIAPKVGLTAAAFADLSSDQKLGAYINALERANVSQADMTFYMEAIASDSTALVPAFQNNSEAINEMAKRAADLGLVIDRETIAKSRDAKNELDLMSKVINMQLTQALLSVAPVLTSTAAGISTIAASVREFFDSMGEARAANDLQDVTSQFNRLEDQIALFEANSPDSIIPINALGGIELARERLEALRAELAALSGEVDSGGAGGAAQIMPEADLSRLKEAVEAEREQARLAGVTAEERERARIAAEADFLVQQALANISGTPFTVESTAARIEAEALREQYIAAATAASSILNPVKAVGAATRAITPAAEEATETFEQMLAKMIEASPALKSLGFDAGGLQSTMQMVESSMESAFMSMVDGTMSAKDAFKSMASDIIRELFRVLVVQRLVGGITSALGFPALPAGGPVVGAASGRSMQAGQPHVVGEHGRELFVPQTAGRVLSVSQAQNAVGSGGSVVINQTINVSTGVQQTVRTEIKQLMPQIAESAKAAVVDAKRRGGSYGRAFS